MLLSQKNPVKSIQKMTSVQEKVIKNPTHLAVYEYDCEFLLLLHKIRYIFALVYPLECSIHEP